MIKDFTKRRKYSFQGTQEELMQSLLRAEEDFKNGRFTDHDEFMRELKREFLF